MTLVTLFVVLCIVALVNGVVSEKTNLRGDVAVASTTTTADQVAIATASKVNGVAILAKKDPKDAPTSAEVMKALEDWCKGLDRHG